MARANRHYIPGHVWHITHRCHKREFLLRFARDRRRWLQWLFEGKKRFGTCILNYAVTSNHIHLLVRDGQEGEVIPQTMQLILNFRQFEKNMSRLRLLRAFSVLPIECVSAVAGHICPARKGHRGTVMVERLLIILARR